MAFTNTATSTNTAIRGLINLNDSTRTMEINNNGVLSLSINSTGQAAFSQTVTAPTITATTSVTAPSLSATTLSSSGVFTPSGTGGIASTYHSTINLNTAGGGGTRTITFNNRGIYLVFIGANYNDSNCSITLLLTHSGTGSPCRVMTINNPGFSIVVGSTTAGFTISGNYPSNYNAFDVSYIYLSF
jgi:hypothetical protein